MITQLGEFFRSQTSRLLLTYLAIIMAMSISFSAIIYGASIHQLERQLPSRAPSGIYIDDDGIPIGGLSVQSFIQEQVAQGKKELLIQLYVLNLVMLIFGAAFSYMLARWTLEPIEQNVEAQTRFVSDASHELRTPLTAIQATNEVALRRKKLTLAEAKEVIQSNLDDVQRLQRMSSMLLQLASSDDNKLLVSPVAVHEIVPLAITNVAVNAVTKKITIDDTTKNNMVLADVESAAQALTILLDNAIKYSPEGSQVTVATQQRRSMVALSVADHGPGIAHDEQKKIFDRFYRSDTARTHDSTGGYGLGLEIAQKIAKSHHGTIELTSTPGKGSTFSLLLPSAKAQPKK